MIIIDNRDFIRKALEENGLDLYDFHENHQVFSIEAFSKLNLTRRMDVLLIDTQSVLDDPKAFEKCKAVLNTFQGAFFFHNKDNAAARSWVHDQASFLPKVLGEWALPMAPIDWTYLANQLQFFWTTLQEQRMLQKHMAVFSKELDQVLESAQWEMARARRIHEALVPKRMEEIKGVQYYIKYGSGESGGVEFCDLHQTGTKVFVIFVGSESYLISSAILGILNAHKNKDFKAQGFLADANEDIATINGPKRKKAQVDLLVLEMDPSRLTLRAHGNHKAEFHSLIHGKVVLHKDEEYKLTKGEKFIVFSPGFLFNWIEGDHKQDIHSFVAKHPALSQQELMTELFFHIHQEKGSQFLKKGRYSRNDGG